jgi:mono/diheme cytochrome c family protein
MKAWSGTALTAASVIAMAWGMTLASVAGAVPSAAQKDMTAQRLNGASIYKTYCATCHGAGGMGDGPLASSLRRRPANLTEIAKRNNGAFPAEMVHRIIDGRQPVRGHGGPDMPVWGDAFLRTTDGGTEEGVKLKIQSLVAFLESVQLREGW